MKKDMLPDIYLSLISHTNVGKTSLARTLLRKDIGAAEDRPHVTDKSEAHPMIVREQGGLYLWDTPGFGDIRTVLKRIEKEGGATGWIRHHLVDRFKNRPLFCSIEALKTIREQCDLVLYLVNAHEEPESAGYPKLEMKLLSHFSKPVLVIINQLGQNQDDDYGQEVLGKWQTFMGRYDFVHAVLILDAFFPNPEQEHELWNSVVSCLTPPKRSLGKDLFSSYFEDQEKARYHCASEAFDVFRSAVSQAQPLEGSEKESLGVLQSKLAQKVGNFTATLMETYQISAADQATIRAELKDLRERVKMIPEKQAGLWGGLVSGALSGLTADILSGGFSFGGGALLGGVSGWLAAFYGSRGFNSLFRKGERNLRWSDAFLIELFILLAALNMRVLHHGRAKGVLFFQDLDETEFWVQRLQRYQPPVGEMVKNFRRMDLPEAEDRFLELFHTILNGSK